MLPDIQQDYILVSDVAFYCQQTFDLHPLPHQDLKVPVFVVSFGFCGQVLVILRASKTCLVFNKECPFRKIIRIGLYHHLFFVV